MTTSTPKTTKKTADEKVVVTIYTTSPEDGMLRFCILKSEARVMRNQLMNGIPYLLNNPVFADTISSVFADQPFHALLPKRTGCSLIVSPRGFSHFYVDTYRESK